MKQLNSRLPILDIWVDPVTKVEALERVRDFLISGDRPHSIFASNPEKNFSVPKNQQLYECYRNADLLLPDGIGVVMAARKLYDAQIERVPGAEFIFDICEFASENDFSIYIYGAKEEVNKRSAEILAERYPTLNIAGRANGYVREDKMEQLVAEINASGAEILFVGLGSPKQEKWFSDWSGRLNNVRVVQGIGGTLDTIGGTVKRAPEFWCRHNLEWFYRLISEPARLKRQRVLPIFAYLVMKEWLFGRRGNVRRLDD